MPGVAQRLKLRLFVEGVEFPVIACTVQAQPNSPTMASIQIPPLSEGTRLLPRSLVHVFFLDFGAVDTSSMLTNNPVTGSQQTEAEASQAQDTLMSNYKLLFVGDLMGFTWTKSSTSRSLVLQCADPSNYWDYAYQFNNQDLFGPGYKAMFSGGATNLFTDMLEDPGAAIVRIIMTPSVRYPGLEGLVGGLVHLLEAMGGSYYSEKKFAGQNIFYSLAELRLRLTQMVTAYAGDKTAKKLLGGGYDSLFGRSIGNVGAQASFRKIINMLAGVIFHETYGQPCPKYSPGTGGTLTGFSGKGLATLPGAKDSTSNPFAPIVSSARDLQGTIDTLITGYGGEPHLFPEKVAKLTDSLNGVKNQCNAHSRSCNTLASQYAAKGQTGVASSARTASSIFSQAAKSASDIIAAVRSKKVVPSGSLEGLKTSFSRIPEIKASSQKAKDVVPAILGQQIFRPDVWFSAPPKCNVIFPDQYSSLTYSRQFMAEPTRLLLKTNSEYFGEDELFDNFFFAPKAITLKQERNTLQAMLRGDILDHELFTGILPVFEKMGEFNIFAARSGNVDKSLQKVGLAQRSTNFLYFKYRFAPRQLQLQGRFNPYVAVGFPGLVIDKYVDIDTLKLHQSMVSQTPPQESIKVLGTHFLASFTEVTHQVDQRQGTTVLNCSYARQAEESVEFLGSVQHEVSVSSKASDKPARKISVVASQIPPRPGSQGPNLGNIVAVKDVTKAYSNRSLPIYGSARDPRTSQLINKAKIDTALADTGAFEAYRAYEVVEDIYPAKKEVVDIPPEEYIRPGWYGDCWKPSEISKVYYDFFDIGSITEPIEVAAPMSWEDASELLQDPNTEDTASYDLARRLTYLALNKDANIQQAVTYLVLTYSAIKHFGFDTHDFIHNYTKRPIATMLDMFGSYDLQFDATGTAVIQGTEGFHSRAFGPYDNLFGLVTPDIEEVVGIKIGSPQAQRADTRKRKFEAALLYPAQLRISKAILG